MEQRLKEPLLVKTTSDENLDSSIESRMTNLVGYQSSYVFMGLSTDILHLRKVANASPTSAVSGPSSLL